MSVLQRVGNGLMIVAGLFVCGVAYLVLLASCPGCCGGDFVLVKIERDRPETIVEVDDGNNPEVASRPENLPRPDSGRTLGDFLDLWPH